MLPCLPNQAIRAINGNENHETTAEEFTNSVFDRIDINGDGEWTEDGGQKTTRTQTRGGG